nr:immunoglobulin light chain junction region [Macaca mulatta]MOX78375.1 immunoglobulin light chain junction region [Macaca mulatta]MOX79323.1 immunoglobulin light chain junction region [Macaca mulatta]MOX80580.1 immunoglobulin light chain junction region [Macaca mulatta]MOX80997.1 immunoglobulin light chain junction region [Macaca mulatta]
DYYCLIWHDNAYWVF